MTETRNLKEATNFCWWCTKSIKFTEEEIHIIFDSLSCRVSEICSKMIIAYDKDTEGWKELKEHKYRIEDVLIKLRGYIE